MKRYINIVFIFIWFCLPNQVSANQFDSKADSLAAVIEKTSRDDTLRLAALRELALIEQSTDKGLELATELISEAQRLKVDKYIALGGYYSLVYHYNRQHSDSVFYFSKLVAPLAEKEKLWIVYFDVLKFRTITHVVNENFELAINDALKMYEKAHEVQYNNGIIAANMCLAMSYTGSERLEEGMKALQEAYSILANTESEVSSFDVLGLLVGTSFQLKDYESMLKYNKELEEAIHGYISDRPFSEVFHNHLAYIELYYGYYYLSQKEFDKALTHFRKADEHLGENGFSLYKLQYEDAMTEYHRVQKEYEKALFHLDRHIAGISQLIPKDYYTLIARKANIMAEIGKTEDALGLYQEYLRGKDSITHAISNKQMAQIQEIYNVNQLLLEKEKIKNNRQKFILSAIIVSIILALAFTIRSFFVRRKLKEAEQKMREATLLANEANEIKNRFLSNMSYNVRTPLNSVVGFSQLMSADPDMDETQRKEYAAIIKKNSEELMNLVNNVLDLSRLEAGMMKFNLTKYEVGSLVQDVLYMAKSKNEGKIAIRLENHAENEEIITDSSRFMQLLLSLVTYTFDSDEQREILVTITKEAKNNEVLFNIIGSPLANPEFSNQETTIRNEINRLFVLHFNGSYNINPEGCPAQTIVFTYPLSNS